jgi:hypothetical protein
VRLFRLTDRQTVVLEGSLGGAALLAFSSGVASIFSVLCDPRIVVAGASPFGSPAIFGAPVKHLAMFAVLGLMTVVAAGLPRAWLVLKKFRIVIYIVALLAAIVLPSFHYPHQILGACVS